MKITFPLIIFVAFISSGVLSWANQALIPFSTDGCSAAPDRLVRIDITMCCVKHDIAYWMGGTQIEKSIADMRLNSCLEHSLQGSLPGAPSLYHTAVEIFGGPEYLGLINNPFSWRWGYGWRINRGFQAITSEEFKFIREDLERFKSFVKASRYSKQGDSLYRFRFEGITLSDSDLDNLMKMIESSLVERK